MSTTDDSPQLLQPSASPPRNNRGFFQLQPGQTYDESRSSALSGLLKYSFLMFTLPLLTFFGVQHFIAEEYPDLGQPWTMLWPALCSIMAVNLIIVLYVIKAFKEDRKEQARPGEEQRKKN